MNQTRRRLATTRGDDRGSAVAFLPILGLLVIAGIAALVGIALQPSNATPVAAPIPNPELGPSCVSVAGPFPTTRSAQATWVQSLANCVRDRIEGTVYGADGTASGTRPVSGLENYDGVTLDRTFSGGYAVVVHWKSDSVPPIVIQRIGAVPTAVKVAFVLNQNSATPTATSTATPSS